MRARPPSLRRALLSSALVAPLLAWGCGDSSGDGTAGSSGGEGGTGGSEGGHGGHTTCGLQENCGRTEEVTLEVGLEADGADGNFVLHLHMHNTLAPEGNEWMIMIVDDAGSAVADATVSASTWSDDCSHPGPTAPEVVTTDAAGLATIHPVTAHGGPWDVILEIDAAGTTDTITIPLCIPGESHDLGDGGVHDEETADGGVDAGAH